MMELIWVSNIITIWLNINFAQKSDVIIIAVIIFGAVKSDMAWDLQDNKSIKATKKFMKKMGEQSMCFQNMDKINLLG